MARWLNNQRLHGVPIPPIFVVWSVWSLDSPTVYCFLLTFKLMFNYVFTHPPFSVAWNPLISLCLPLCLLMFAWWNWGLFGASEWRSVGPHGPKGTSQPWARRVEGCPAAAGRALVRELRPTKRGAKVDGVDTKPPHDGKIMGYWLVVSNMLSTTLSFAQTHHCVITETILCCWEVANPSKAKGGN